MKSKTKWAYTLSLGILTTISLSVPSQAADSLIVVYGPLKEAVKVSSLERFVETGEVEKDLEFYFNSVTPEQKEEFRKVLTRKIQVDAIALSHFLNSSVGNDLLDRFGRIVTLPGGANGKSSLRGAIIQASLEESKGLSLLTVLQNFSTDIQIDGEVLQRVNKAIDQFFLSTQSATKTLQTLAVKEAQTDPPIKYAKLPSLTKPGPYPYTKQTINLQDISRGRSFYVLIYKPKVPGKQKIPVVIISHGLAAKPEEYSPAAISLASHGFLVALPQHPGSDLQQAKDLFDGYVSQVFELQEFINRPKDVSFVIDELEKRNPREYQGRLNLKQVGVIGHSFGGYTALVLAGAQIDFDNLQQDCNRVGYINISLLLQCRALDLKHQKYQLADPRVTAIMARNPLNSSLFGARGLGEITIPTFLIAGSYDLATPVVSEQMFSFPLLVNAPKTYFGLLEGQAHVDFSQLDAGVSNLVKSATNLMLPNPTLVNQYSDAVTIAFFKVYIAGDKKYLPYLQSSYGVYLSNKENFKFSLLTGASKTAVATEVEKLRENFALGR